MLRPSPLPFTLLLSLWVFISSTQSGLCTAASHLVISEFMADNETTLADGDGTFEDWIEIYNPTANAVALDGYYLTDDSANLTKWMFPAQTLTAGSRLLVFASSKAGAAPVGQLHTNFKLAKAGEYLALVAPDGSSVLHAFSPSYPAQTADISYGIIGGDLATLQYMGNPTPGSANDAALPAPGPVNFSLLSQTFTGTLGLDLSSDRSGAAVYYTTDGSTPSSTNGTLYTSTITLSSTTYVQAVAIISGEIGAVSGQSYIRLAADLASYQSDLPLLVIENFGGGTIPAKGWNQTGAGIQQVPRQPAAWATFAVDSASGIAALADAPQMISRLGIRGRGAFSSSWAQKPYSVKAWDAYEEEKDIGVLGMPAHSDWVLYYPSTGSSEDPSMMFNTFIYELSQNMGRYSARFRFVEAFINEDGGDLTLADRRGVYVILEKVSRGNERLDFDKLSADGTTGGFLVGINRLDSIPVGGFPADNGATSPQNFHTKGPDRISQTSPNSTGGGDDFPQQGNARINFDNPSGYKINANQRAAIEDWFDAFEDVLYDDSLWLDPENGYQKYIDREDFVDYFIFNNLSRNGDGMLLSMFPWKGDDGKLRMGPAWDYNYGSYYMFDNSSTGSLWHRGNRLWYGRLFSDPDFTQLYIDRWFAFRDSALSNAGIAAIVDNQSGQIGSERAVRQGFANESAWTAETSKFKNWITDRADWYDTQFISRPTTSPSPGDIAPNSLVSLSAGSGEIYYTLDGSDPRAAGGAAAANAQLYGDAGPGSALFSTGAAVRLIIPTSSSPSTTEWTAPAFDDSAWLSGTTGVGYDRQTTYDSDISLNLDSHMDGVNTSAYMRIDFNLTDPSAFSTLLLKMKYDDGFVAYINGIEVASSFAPVSHGWNSSSTGQRSDNASQSFTDFDITAHLDKLAVGENVLAIHGLNYSLSSSDFLIVPELLAGEAATGPGIAIPDSTLVTARVKNGSSWSAPTSAYYFVDTVAASASNLVVSEFNYRPADASASEASAGFTDRDDFEFIELLNISNQTVNLTGAKFIRVNGQGIEVDLTSVYPRTLAAGEKILLVKNKVAFLQRYGASTSDRVVGEYSGNLGNDGELITLVDSLESTIKAFTYNDQAPWPEFADGDGPSLTLIRPADNPDHNIGSNWRNSVSVNGSPGFLDSVPFSGDSGDLLGYAVGTPLSFEPASPQIFSLNYALNIAADDSTVELQSSTNLTDWHPYTPTGGLIWTFNGDGTMHYNANIDRTAETERFFLRLKVIAK